MPDDRLDELDIKLAFQDKLIAELGALVRQLGERLDKTDRELKQLKDSLASPELPLGAPTEKPPHY
ncbi:MAG TPA: SlyX family protein [Kofleriaceae bacterium]